MGKSAGGAYAAAGVDYDALDRFKRACQVAGRQTLPALSFHQLSEPAGVRGESAYLVEADDCFIAHVEEGLGTKNTVADEMARANGFRGYHAIGIDTVACIVNDMITCGALPAVVAMHAGVGSSNWFDVAHRGEDLAAGFAEGCRLAGAAWGGGETPMLKGVVEPDGIVLAGSAWGFIRPKTHRIKGDVQPGDSMIFLRSSGVHANGLTLCRKIADAQPDRYLTRLSDGMTLGESLLAPTTIYAPLIRDCQQEGIALRYAINVTGHGWRKMMRLDAPLCYRVDEPGVVSSLFEFLVGKADMTPEDAYGTFNMGVGFVVIVRPTDERRVLDLAQSAGLSAWKGGVVLDSPQGRRVDVPSLKISFLSDALQVRG
ncbi:MAG: phosphoribosylformylglycinamidine cyclo-ligase [Deltaproteobacteria bacterium]|nr:phosphoribosylformylglycinamidine cyclo-ligase [Deltaproteobacteria bacterium]